MKDYYNITWSELTYAQACGSFGIMAGGFIANRLNTRLGLRRLSIIVGGVVPASFLIIYFIPPEWYLLILPFHFSLTAALGMSYVVTMSTIQEHFTTKLTTAIQIATTGTTLGTIVLPVFLAWLFREFGFINGWLFYGGVAAHIWISMILLQSPSKTNGAAGPSLTQSDAEATSVFKTPTFWSYVGAQCCFCMGQMTYIFMIPNVMELTGAGHIETSGLIMVTAVTDLICRIPWSFVADRKTISRHALLSFVLLNLAVVFLLYGRVGSFTEAVCVSVYNGMFICVAGPLSISSLRDITQLYGRPDQYMALLGVSGACYGTAMIAWSIVQGYIADLHGLQILFDLSFVIQIIGAVLALATWFLSKQRAK